MTQVLIISFLRSEYVNIAKKTLECFVVINLFMGMSVYCLLEEKSRIINTPISYYCYNTVLASLLDTPVTSNVPLIAPQNSSPDFHTHQPVLAAYSKDGGRRVVSLSP